MLAKHVLDEGFANEQRLLRLNPEHSEGVSTIPDYQLAFGVLDAELGQPRQGSEWIGKALRSLAEARRLRPHDQLGLFDMFETLIVSVLLDAKAGRATGHELLAELEGLIRDVLRRAEDDPRNVRARSLIVSARVALAEHALVLGRPGDAFESLEKASAELAPALRTSTGLPVLRCLEVRLDTLRGEVLQWLGKTEEAKAEAERAVTVAEPLASEESAYLFDLACARAQQARLDPSNPDPPAKAVSALRLAVHAGFDNAYKLQHDDRLAPLRSREDLRALIRIVKDRQALPIEKSAAPQR